MSNPKGDYARLPHENKNLKNSQISVREMSPRLMLIVILMMCLRLLNEQFKFKEVYSDMFELLCHLDSLSISFLTNLLSPNISTYVTFGVLNEKH